MAKGERIPKEAAEKVASNIQAVLQPHMAAQICGSLRRGTLPTVGDIDVVVQYLDKACQLLGWHEPKQNGKKKRVAEEGWFEEVHINLYQAYIDAWGAMELFLTGNFMFNIQMRAIAKKDGMKLNQYGLWTPDGNLIAARTERQIFDVLGLPYIPPDQRELKQNENLWSIRRASAHYHV